MSSVMTRRSPRSSSIDASRPWISSSCARARSSLALTCAPKPSMSRVKPWMFVSVSVIRTVRSASPSRFFCDSAASCSSLARTLFSRDTSASIVRSSSATLSRYMRTWFSRVSFSMSSWKIFLFDSTSCDSIEFTRSASWAMAPLAASIVRDSSSRPFAFSSSLPSRFFLSSSSPLRRRSWISSSTSKMRSRSTR